MRCGRARRYISEYVDGTLDSRRTQSLLRHADNCAECRLLIRDFQAMAREAGQLERLTPPDSAWLGIRERVRETKAAGAALDRARDAEAAFKKGRVFRPVFPRPHLAPALATAAVFVLVVSLGVVYFLPWQTSQSAESAGVDNLTLAKLDEAQKHYELSVKALSEALEAQRGNLDPEVSKVFEQNLAIVDASIQSCQQAVRRDPRDLEAQYALLSSYKQKVQLMTEFISVKRTSGQDTSSDVTL